MVKHWTHALYSTTVEGRKMVDPPILAVPFSIYFHPLNYPRPVMQAIHSTYRYTNDENKSKDEKFNL